MRRLGIYVFFDEEGIVDRYVICFLKAVKPLMDHLVVVCNGVISDAGMMVLRTIADNVIVRENFGYDGMAVRYVLVDQYGWDKVCEYDKIVVMNDTFFGPFWSLENIFTEMEGKNVDLWGILAGIKGENENANITMLAAFFYEMSQKLIRNRSWQNFWEGMDGVSWTYSEAVSEYEYRLIPECEKAGGTWDAYLRSDNQNGERLEDGFAGFNNIAFDLIKYYHFPFLKRKPMANIIESVGFGNSDATAAWRSIRYLKEHTNYDTDMIWENIIRKYDISDIKKCLQLTKIFTEDSGKGVGPVLDDIAIILKTEQENWAFDYIILLKKLNCNLPLCVFTSNKNIQKRFAESLESKAYNYQLKDFTDFSQYLKDIKKSIEGKKLVLYIDDSMLVNNRKPTVEGRTLQMAIEMCMWKSDTYIRSIVEEFDSESRLGVGILPKTYHGEYIRAMQSYWGGVNYFLEIRDWLQKQGCHITLNENSECINDYPVFWTRSSVLYESCDALLTSCDHLISCTSDIIKRIVPYIAQKQGYYTMEFLSVEYAQKNYSNLQTIVEELLKAQWRNGFEIKEYRDLRLVGLREFCSKYQKIYIYGAGVWGKRVLAIVRRMQIDNLEGFIVSNGQKTNEKVEDYPVYELREIKSDSITGIVIAVRASQYPAIVRNLKGKGLQNVYKIHDML